MKYISSIILTSILMLYSFTILATEVNGVDKRISLHLTNEEKADFLSEMRRMLSSVQGVMSGIASNNRKLIISSARYSGNRMARATPESVKQKNTTIIQRDWWINTYDV